MEYILNTTGHELKYTFIKADNCTLYDSDGNRYLDLESGVWCTSIGHCHPRISKVIAEQAMAMMHSGYCYLHPLINETAAKILQITGIGPGKCVFLSSGSEAVEFSVQLSQRISNKKHFLTMKNCYLSAYGVSGERSAMNWIHFDWMNTTNLDGIDFSTIAAFVFEPGSSLGLVHFPPYDLIQEIVARVREHDGIVIVNEVTTGTGRTGKWFGFQHYDITPDIVAIGKGLGNGYPVSCVAIGNKLLERYDVRSFHYGQSHQNDPLGAAVARAVIDVIEKDHLLERAVHLGAKIRERISEIKMKSGIIKEVRGRGLMIAVEFHHHPTISYSHYAHDQLLENKIILVKRPGHEVLRIDPALTISTDEVDYFLNMFEEILCIRLIPSPGTPQPESLR